MRNRTTITDLAREVGLSKTAVSFAFNAPERLAATTLKRILDKAAELGYAPDPLARRLARRSSGNLGVLIPQGLPQAFVHPHFQELFQGVGAFCESHHLSLTILPPLEGSLVAAVQNAAVDGVITLGFTPSAPFVELLAKRGLPLVTVDSRVDRTIPSVTFRDQEAAHDLMATVLARGFRRIHVLTFPTTKPEVGGNAGSRALTRRMKGIHEAIEQSGIPGITLTTSPSSVSVEGAKRALRAEPWTQGRPQVIVCLSDAQAAGVYEYAEGAGLRIPEDLSVTGFDGCTVLKHLRPVLTTVVQPGFLKGRLAAALMDDQWQGRPVRHLVLKPRRIVGASLGSL
jgi:DNA-binding LacI/PurR family transcriptional regulator